MGAILGNMDVSNKLILFYTIYTNLNYKLQKEIKRLEIYWDRFKRLISSEGRKISQKKKKRDNEILVYIYFEIRELVLIWF